MRVATANLQAIPPRRQRRVRADLLEIRDGLDPDVLALQEAWLPRYRLSARRVFRVRSGWDRVYAYGWSGTGLIWSRRHWALVDSGRALLHGRVTVAGRVVSSARRIAWARLRDRTTGDVVTFASVHFTPSAFSRRFSGARKARVRRAWDTGATNLREFVEHQLRHGPVVVAGDFNARRRQVLDALADPRGQINGHVVRCPPDRVDDVDHIVTVGRWDVGRARRRANGSDHDVRYLDAQVAP